MSKHIPRLFIDAELDKGRELTLDSAASHHLLRVLRRQVGDAVILFNGRGGEWQASIQATRKTAASVTVLEFVVADRESPLDITLAQCLCRGDRMDYAIQKATELGVSRIAPLLGSDQKPLKSELASRRLLHWHGVARSAAEQCGRTRVPEILALQRLSDWLALPAESLRLLLDTDGPGALPAQASESRFMLLVGHEGGLATQDQRIAVDAGYLPVRLGPRILRAETAGPTAIAALQTRFGDLGR